MKVIYTDSGKEALKEFHASQERLLEKLVCEQKYVLGDDVVEVTAADIKRVSATIQPISRLVSKARGLSEGMVVVVPLGLLILMMTLGVFMYWKDPAAFSALNSSSILMTVLGAFAAMLVAMTAAMVNLSGKRHRQFMEEFAEFEGSALDRVRDSIRPSKDEIFSVSPFGKASPTLEEVNCEVMRIQALLKDLKVHAEVKLNEENAIHATTVSQRP